MALDGFDSAFDFVLAFAMVHELPSAEIFFVETARAMKPGARLLLAEPAGHVGEVAFDQEPAFAAQCGFGGLPPVRGSGAAGRRS